MNNFFPYCFAFSLLAGFSGCEKPTEPKDTPEPDTTSHNFVWRVDTIGTYLSVVLDVAIVDENNIWAVGEFYKKHSTFDSTVKDQYNAAHWNGVRWELKRVPIEVNYGIGYGGIVDTTFHPIYCVFVVNSKIIFSSGGVTLLENGRNELLRTPSFNEKAGENNFWSSKIWAKDENNIWFVGPFGTIIYYNGTTFTKIPYDESVDFVDIWGDETGVVRAVARKANSFESAIVRISQSSAEMEFSGLNQPVNSPIPDIFISVWWDQAENFFVGADNGFFRKSKTGFTRLFSPYDEGETKLVYAVRGMASNDVFIAGNNGQIVHYNGKTSVLYRNAVESYPFRRFETVHYSGNVVCAGGYIAGVNGWDDQLRGFVLIGKRY